MLSRLSADATTQSTQDLDLSGGPGSRSDVQLEPGDRIIVRGTIDVRGDFNVDLKGEVKVPGTYPITQGHTRLSEVIRWAGGFTDLASLSSAKVLRQSFDKQEAFEEEVISKRGIVSTQDTVGYGLETSLRVNRGAVTVDFEKLFAEGDSSQDVILRAEDQIVVPTRESTVYVFGQVASPGHIAYLEHKDLSYYVGKAGGYSGRANRGETKIVKAKTKQWLSPGDTMIEPGDFVWVPPSPDRDFSYYMTITSQAASILSVIIGVAVLVVQVSK
jgi:protein involved in polysaccharide export with SLBB domain